MAFQAYLTPGTTPFGAQLPGNLQALINVVCQYALIAGLGDIGGINYGYGTPSPENRDFPWWRTDINGNPIGMFNWNGSDWVTVNPPMVNGPTSSRPLNPVEGTQYEDTDINVALIYNRGAWRTLSGSPGDVKEVIAVSLAQALLSNPGWFQHTDSVGCVIGAAGENTARGLTNRIFGSFVGEEAHAITEAELPAHTHTTTANWGQGGEGGGDNPLYYDDAQAPGVPQVQPNTGITGSGTAMSLMQPTYFLWRLYKQ